MKLQLIIYRRTRKNKESFNNRNTDITDIYLDKPKQEA